MSYVIHNLLNCFLQRSKQIIKCYQTYPNISIDHLYNNVNTSIKYMKDVPDDIYIQIILRMKTNVHSYNDMMTRIKMLDTEYTEQASMYEAEMLDSEEFDENLIDESTNVLSSIKNEIITLKNQVQTLRYQLTTDLYSLSPFLAEAFFFRIFNITEEFQEHYSFLENDSMDVQYYNTEHISEYSHITTLYLCELEIMYAFLEIFVYIGIQLVNQESYEEYAKMIYSTKKNILQNDIHICHDETTISKDIVQYIINDYL